MPWDCGLICFFTERRRHIEILWRRRLLVTEDERKAKRRFLNLMRGFDTEDLDVLRKAIESNGLNIKQCAPGPPMDLVEEREESSSEDEGLEPEVAAGCSTTVLSTRPRHSMKDMERDRILFQRQRYPTLTSIQQQSPSASGPNRNRADCQSTRAGSQQTSTYQRRHSKNSRPSNFNRRAICLTTENGTTLQPVTIFRTRSISSSEPDEVEGKQGPSRRGGITDGQISSIQNVDIGLIPQIDKPMSMPYLCCKMWRWKDLQVDAALHRLEPLPWCRFGKVTINKATVSCCNPFHYGLWIKPETSSSEEQSINSGILVNGSGTVGGQTIDTTVGGDTTIGHVRSAFLHSLHTVANYSSAASDNGKSDSPPRTPPPAPPIKNSSELHVGNHLCAFDNNRRVSHSAHHQAMCWGRMARWQGGERVGEVVALVGKFVVVGRLAGTVFDGQDIKTCWDMDNSTSFALLREPSDKDSEYLDEVWLYNSSDKPLFMCASRSISRVSSSNDTPGLRRLSPGYCIRVHRTSRTLLGTSTEVTGNDLSSYGETHAQSPPVSLLTVSIGSGWGANYDHKSITDLLCRYEVIFT